MSNTAVEAPKGASDAGSSSPRIGWPDLPTGSIQGGGKVGARGFRQSASTHDATGVVICCEINEDLCTLTRSNIPYAKWRMSYGCQSRVKFGSLGGRPHTISSDCMNGDPECPAHA
eukprot:scaffold184876_cov36-Tisochrysis_lutea.AAC.1